MVLRRNMIKDKISMLLEQTTSNDFEQSIMSWIIKNPNFKDSDLHKWVEDNKIGDIHKVESFIYTIATIGANILTQGKGKDLDIKTIDPREYAAGIKTEMEHTNNKEISEVIAKSHWAEDKWYYLGKDGNGGGLIDWEKSKNDKG